MEVEAFDSMDARNVQGDVYEPTLSITVREEIVDLYNYGLQTSDISRKYREFSFIFTKGKSEWTEMAPKILRVNTTLLDPIKIRDFKWGYGWQITIINSTL